MKKIGWFTWQPEMISDKSSSAGGAVWTRYLLHSFENEGHKVFWLADGDTPEQYQRAANSEVDILFINWRWEMPAYPERQKLYEQQMQIVDEVGGKAPIVVHDQDHKISEKDWGKLKKAGAIVCAPELLPRKGVRELHFPNPFKTTYETHNKMPFMMENDLAYIGNVYERYEMAMKYLKPMSEKFRVKIWGNWLEGGPDRPGEKQVKKDFPNVDFRGRLSQKMVVEMLASATSTIHLHKESYGPTGFITLRWAEAAAAATLAFIPKEFGLKPRYKKLFEQTGVIVDSGEQMVERYEIMMDDTWAAIVEAQKAFVNEVMTVEPWLELVEEVTK